MVARQEQPFLHIDNRDDHGRATVAFEDLTDGAVLRPRLIAMTSFRSNTVPDKYMVAVSETSLDDADNGAREEVTFYVGATEAAYLASAFAAIAGKLAQ